MTIEDQLLPQLWAILSIARTKPLIKKFEAAVLEDRRSRSRLGIPLVATVELLHPLIISSSKYSTAKIGMKSLLLHYLRKMTTYIRLMKGSCRELTKATRMKSSHFVIREPAFIKNHIKSTTSRGH